MEEVLKYYYWYKKNEILFVYKKYQYTCRFIIFFITDYSLKDNSCYLLTEYKASY